MVMYSAPKALVLAAVLSLASRAAPAHAFSFVPLARVSSGRSTSTGARARWGRLGMVAQQQQQGRRPAPPGQEGYVLTNEEGRSTVPRLPPLRNRYFALRHGQSVANIEGIISSDPAVGTVKHGLTTSGTAQARAAATKLLEEVGRESIDDLVFVSSDFTRARQTAEECRAAVMRIAKFEREVVGETFDCPAVAIRQELRERFFGELDGTVLLNYNKVWPEDLVDSRHAGHGVECVESVCRRIRQLFLSLEQEFSGKCLVLTSHADTLQILQCYVAGADERLFSQYRFKNGEVRALEQLEDSLPLPKPLSYN